MIYDIVSMISEIFYLSFQTLIPYKQDVDSRPEMKKIGESYRHYSEEARELKEVSLF